MQAPLPTIDEPQRQRELLALGVLDTPPEDRFDRLVRVAKAYFDTPIALVTLVDAKRQWFKSRIGLDETELPRDFSFCGHTIHSTSVFEVPDATLDERFHDNPLVIGAPYVRFYAGAPLISPAGRALGTLCIVDTKPRKLTGADAAVLRDLADTVQHELTHSADAAAHLEAETEQLTAVLNTVLDSIITMDESGTIQSANPSTRRLFGYAPAELVGRPLETLMPEPYRSEHRTFVTRYLSTGTARNIDKVQQMLGQRRDGSTFPIELAVGEMQANGVRSFVSVIRDITARKALEDELRKSAREDPLTGLQNRNVLREYTARALPQARRAGRHIACLYIDLDRFKPVNDHFGHEAGDAVLKTIARRLREHVRDGDLVVRAGGDEFLILMEDCPDLPFAQSAAARITDAIAKPMDTQWGTIEVKASAGVALFPDDATDESGLIEVADQRMYEAKRSNR